MICYAIVHYILYFAHVAMFFMSQDLRSKQLLSFSDDELPQDKLLCRPAIFIQLQLLHLVNIVIVWNST